MTNDDARLIAQDFLDRQGEATISGDIEGTLDWCDLPCTLESLQGQTVATTKAEMRVICAVFINKLKERQLAYMVRNCLKAVFKNDDTIWATYETRYVGKDNQLSDDPYIGFVILVKKSDSWKISKMQFATSANNATNAALKNLESKKPTN